MKRFFWLLDLIVLVIIFVLHEWTKRLMADSTIVSAIFAAGQQVPTVTIIAGIAFVILRAFVIVLLPAIMISRWGLWIICRVFDLKIEEEDPPEKETRAPRQPVAAKEPLPSSPRFFG